VSFGNLPPSTLQFERSSTETKEHARVAVVRFNIWLPPVATAFEQAMPELRAADAIVIDLRGNPGGVSAVAQGVAGHFVAETISLGTMKGRRDHLELVAQPRRVARDGSAVEPYRGPLAVLIDEGSASTSELFAAGLRDHDRARLFGSRSAGAALPAVMDRLPNGDVFLHAAMDYIRPNGERVEGRPIVPDVETPLLRANLRAGRDAALEAALSWIDAEL
jgi:carboxyl-terminal processing protease